MSCMDVMYQSSLSSCFPTPFPTANYAPYPSPTSSSSATSKAITGESALKKFGSSRIYPDRHAGSSSSSSSSRLSESLATGCGSSSVTSSNSNMGATSSYSSRVGLCVSDAAGGRASNSTRSGKEVSSFEEEKPPMAMVQTTSTSYLLINHMGDAASAVDDHFSRALHPPPYTKNALPMKSRNLPPSFYDPNLTAPVPQQCHTSPYSLSYHGYPSTSSDYSYADPYYPSSFHPATFQPPADWHHAYNSVAAQSFSQRAAAMQMTADFTANRFNSSSYNSLISQGIFPTTPVSMRTSPCKSASSWPSHSVFGAEMPHYSSSSEYDYTFSGNTPSAKELYWH